MTVKEYEARCEREIWQLLYSNIACAVAMVVGFFIFL